MSTISDILSSPPNNFSTTLSANISSSALTVPVNDTTGLGTEGVGVIFQKDSDGNPVTSSIEFIHWTGKSGNNLTLTDTDDRGISGSASGAQAHSSGDTFEVWVHSAYYIDNAITGTAPSGDVVGTTDTQTLTNKTLTSPKLNEDVKLTATATQLNEVVTGGGWISLGQTLTYASATTMTVAADLTGVLQKGDKLKLTQSTGGTKYWPIIDVSESGGTTTITVPDTTTNTLANEAITSPYYSKIENPQGWPDWFEWTPTITYAGGSTNPTSATTNQAIFKVVGKEVVYQFKTTITRGSGNRTFVRFTLPINYVGEDYMVQTSLESIVTTSFVLRSGYLENNNRVSVSFGAAMAQSTGFVNSSNSYRYA